MAASCRMQTFCSVCNCAFHVALPPASGAMSRLRGASAAHQRLLAHWPRQPGAVRGTGGEVPVWGPYGEPGDRDLPRTKPWLGRQSPAFPGGPWHSPSLSRGCRRSCRVGSKRTRLSSDARLPRVFSAPRPPGSSEEKGVGGGGARDPRANHAAAAMGVQTWLPPAAPADGLTLGLIAGP